MNNNTNNAQESNFEGMDFLKNAPLSSYIFLEDRDFNLSDALFNLKNNWKISVNADMPYYYEDENLLLFGTQDYLVSIEYRDEPFEKESLKSVVTKKYGKDSVLAQKIDNQLSHILVALWSNGKMMDNVIFHTKITDAINYRVPSLGVFMYNDIFEKKDFRSQAVWLQEGLLPVELWIHIETIYVNNSLFVLATNGMDKFEKNEIELLVNKPSKDLLKKSQNFLVNICHMVIEKNSVLEDGQTIGFKDMGDVFNNLKIEVSESKYMKDRAGDTIKININGE